MEIRIIDPIRYLTRKIVMEKTIHGNIGIKRMIQKYRKAFRVRENLEFYAEEDFIVAERKFLKYALLQGKPSTRPGHLIKLR